LRDAGLAARIPGHTMCHGGRDGAKGWRNPTTVRRRLIRGTDPLRPAQGLRRRPQLIVPAHPMPAAKPHASGPSPHLEVGDGPGGS